MRINKYLALHLNTSRRNADELIKAKKITVNNKLAVIGQDIMTTDVITYQNKILSSKIVYKYFKFYSEKIYLKWPLEDLLIYSQKNIFLEN